MNKVAGKTFLTRKLCSVSVFFNCYTQVEKYYNWLSDAHERGFWDVATSTFN